jgi:hypothetical protein
MSKKMAKEAEATTEDGEGRSGAAAAVRERMDLSNLHKIFIPYSLNLLWIYIFY